MEQTLKHESDRKKKKKTLPESTKEVLTHQAADKQNEHPAKEKREKLCSSFLIQDN